jgi:hypothetical protein
MAVLPVLVNLKDGTQRDVPLYGDVCADFWDDTASGEWVALHSGEEVQQVHWMCDVCSRPNPYFGATCIVFRHRDPSAYSTSCRSKQAPFPLNGLGNQGEVCLLMPFMR